MSIDWCCNFPENTKLSVTRQVNFAGYLPLLCTSSLLQPYLPWHLGSRCQQKQVIGVTVCAFELFAVAAEFALHPRLRHVPTWGKRVQVGH